MPPVQLDFKSTVVAEEGFDWVNERPEEDNPKLHKWGYVSSAVGSWVQVGEG